MDTVNRVSRQQFLDYVAAKNGVTVDSLVTAYDMIFDGIYDIVKSNKRLCLNGFGTFYLQMHKGHQMQFGCDVKSDDYAVFKFSASNTLNKRIRSETFTDIKNTDNESDK